MSLSLLSSPITSWPWQKLLGWTSMTETSTLRSSTTAMVQPIAAARVAFFSLGFSLYLFFSSFYFLSISPLFLFFLFCSLTFGQKFLFLLPARLWVWGFGFLLGFNDLEKEGILIWVWGQTTNVMEREEREREKAERERRTEIKREEGERRRIKNDNDKRVV
ncbi:hypothetical protein ACJW30_05G003600 [Castanea mollissima]